jgi:ACS family tartrate transporter-like MFS transporter
MFLWSRHSDLTGERVWHMLIAAAFAAAGWICCALAANPWVSIAMLAVASAGTYATLSVFWTYPTALLSGRAAAGAIALIGAIGNLGGFVGPWAIGQIRSLSGGFGGGFVAVAAMLALTAAIAWGSGRAIFHLPARAPAE